MTNKKILQVLQFYEAYLSTKYHPVKGEEYERLFKDDDTLQELIPTRRDEALSHVLAMIPQMREFLEQGRRDKVFRWLGFIQGVLWLSGEFSLEKLKLHNRPSSRNEDTANFEDEFFE